MGHGAGEHGTEFTAVVVILLYAETTNLSQAFECGDTVFWADEILCAGLVTMQHLEKKNQCVQLIHALLQRMVTRSVSKM
jgi:hypothetical protein